MHDTDLLVAALLLVAGTFVFRLVGVQLGGTRISPRAQRWSNLAVITLLAGVGSTAMLYDGADFAGWARVAGVSAGTAAAVVRAPLVVVVMVAAGTTATLRAFGVG